MDHRVHAPGSIHTIPRHFLASTPQPPHAARQSPHGDIVCDRVPLRPPFSASQKSVSPRRGGFETHTVYIRLHIHIHAHLEDVVWSETGSLACLPRLLAPAAPRGRHADSWGVIRPASLTTRGIILPFSCPGFSLPPDTRHQPCPQKVAPRSRTLRGSGNDFPRRE